MKIENEFLTANPSRYNLKILSYETAEKVNLLKELMWGVVCSLVALTVTFLGVAQRRQRSCGYLNVVIFIDGTILSARDVWDRHDFTTDLATFLQKQIRSQVRSTRA